jgi:hypothetical protein
LLIACFALSGCETPGQTALLGAAIGSVAGSGHHVIRNAAIGAGAGYLAGRVIQDRRRDDYYDDDDFDRPRRFLYAEPTSRRGFVISPYSGNVIDVRGIPHGARVEDPSVGRVFINP